MSDNQIVEYRTDKFHNANVMVINDIPVYDTEDYDLFNEKDFKKYIDDIERMVRSSKEYRDYIQYLRMYMDMNASAFLKNVTNIDTTKIKIEIHHTPFTLFDITLTVFNKRSRLSQSLDIEMVAKEVAYLHYFLYVGLIPLSKTEHKLVHNQALFIPLNLVLGKFEDFIEMYNKDIPEDAMARYNTYVDMTKHYNPTMNTDILQINPTYLKLPGTDANTLGSYSPAQLQHILTSTQQRLKQITQKQSHAQIEDQQYDNNQKPMTKPFTIDLSAVS